MTLREAKERLEQENTENNVEAFRETLFNYYQSDKWLHVIVSEDGQFFEPFNVNGKWFIAIYTFENDFLPKEYPTIVIGIKKVIDTIKSSTDIEGLILDPIDGSCFYIDTDFIDYCLSNH